MGLWRRRFHAAGSAVRREQQRGDSDARWPSLFIADEPTGQPTNAAADVMRSNFAINAGG